MDSLNGPDLEEAFQSVFSKAYLNSRIGYFKNAIAARPSKFDQPERSLYNNKRYQECMLYIQSLENYYLDNYITYLLKANIRMGNYSSARAITILYTSSKTSNAEKGAVICVLMRHKFDEYIKLILINLNYVDETMKYLNDVIETTHIDEFYIADKLLDCHFNVQNPSYKIEYKNDQKHMIASRKISMGETILIEEPLFSVGNSKCAHCFHDSAVSMCCVKCISVYYCSEDCRSNNQFLHQYLCKLYKHQKTARYAQMALQFVFKMMPTKSELFGEQISMFNNILKTQPMYKSAIKGLLNTSCELIAYALAETKYNCDEFVNIFLNGFDNYYCTYTEFGAAMLIVLFFCKYKCVLIFDNVLGTSNEFYSTLSKFRFSCQPNTIISRSGNKIVLKASRQININDEICCSYFDMIGNTSFLDVLLNNEVALSTLRENCELVCKCKKRPFNYLSGLTNNIDLNCESKDVPADIKCLLGMIISNTRMYLKSKDPELLYGAFNTANEVILNKNHLLLQGIYFELIKHEIGLDNFGNAHQYLPIIINTDHIQFFKRSHAEICSFLLHRTKAMLSKEELPLCFLEVLRDYWKFIEEDVCPRYPNEMLSNIVKTMKSYIFTEDLDSLHEALPLNASMA